MKQGTRTDKKPLTMSDGKSLEDQSQWLTDNSDTVQHMEQFRCQAWETCCQLDHIMSLNCTNEIILILCLLLPLVIPLSLQSYSQPVELWDVAPSVALFINVKGHHKGTERVTHKTEFTFQICGCHRPPEVTFSALEVIIFINVEL